MPEAVQLNDVQVDLVHGRVRRGGGEVPLTAQEYALLAALIACRGRPVSRGQLLRMAWGWHSEGAATRTVDVHIQHLRKKLGLDREIQTVYRFGYRLS